MTVSIYLLVFLVTLSLIAVARVNKLHAAAEEEVNQAFSVMQKSIDELRDLLKEQEVGNLELVERVKKHKEPLPDDAKTVTLDDGIKYEIVGGY
ncbi:MAG: hypothetical protein CMJ20_06915 [Phycisphaeraceae bacterium]|nr:hypothetical protein [Phycisphaeraceae bacterium]|tara:strand:- start:2083 stop:2364 length:282 start_codon:yes stop_codon:yes gene_type:complete